MSAQFNEVLIHIDEPLDDDGLATLEEDIRHERGVVSVGHSPTQHHLMMVVYDTAETRGANFLHHFRDRGLHAQLVGL